MKGIAISLARRHYYKAIKIQHLSEQAMEQAVNTEASGTHKVPAAQQAAKDLSFLKKKIAEETAGKDISFMQDVMDKID